MYIYSGCTFEDKAKYAQKAGAAALLVVNSEPGSCPVIISIL